MTTLYIIVAAVSYLLGSIPFGYVLVKLFRGQDIRETGSGNIGATNVARSGAKGLGLATLVLDAAKGLLAVFLAYLLAHYKEICATGDVCLPALRLMATAALAAVLGHIFPVWLKFKGGKGVATALGVLILLCPKAVPIALAVFVVVVAATRYVSLGSILGAISAPIAAYLLGTRDWQILAPVAIISIVVVAKHHQNIGRLLAGTESRFGASKNSAQEKLS
jgi:glycerol-3-phosphate acyltransferase PlsY